VRLIRRLQINYPNQETFEMAKRRTNQEWQTLIER